MVNTDSFWKPMLLITLIPIAIQFVFAIFSLVLSFLLIFSPTFRFLVLVFFAPESPIWLAGKGQDEDAKASLQRLRGANADISGEFQTMIEARQSSQQVSLKPDRLLENSYESENIINSKLRVSDAQNPVEAANKPQGGFCSRPVRK
jgi:hypothetical protein